MFKTFLIYFTTLLLLGHNTHIDAQAIPDPHTYTYSKYVVSIAKVFNIQQPNNISRLGENHLCAGIIIAPQTILTAAHCVANFEPEFLRVIAGTTNRTNFSRTQVYNVKKILIPPQYDGTMISTFDIALLKVRDRIREDRATAKRLKLLARTYAQPGDSCIHVGWGRVSDEGELADEIQYVDLYILKNDVCEKRLPRPIHLPDVYCAGEPARGGKISCRSDSGGPIFCNGHFAGMAIFTTDCRRVGPTYFTEMTKHLKWIEESAFEKININFRSSGGNKLQLADKFYFKISGLIIFVISLLFC